MELNSGHRRARTELFKHVSATVMLVIVIYAITNFEYFKGASGQGYNLGIAFFRYALVISILQLLISFLLAYLLAPLAYDKIKNGLNPYLIGLISLILCWSLPLILAWLVVGLMELDNVVAWGITLYAFLPILITGILAGRSIKKVTESKSG